tara:strand:- start:1386 stop:2093 length:708 start_codon:yes stop_codon:yes gene_type:complete
MPSFKSGAANLVNDIYEWWSSEDIPGNTTQQSAFNQNFLDKADIYMNYDLQVHEETPNSGAYSEELINTALSLVGDDTVMPPTDKQPGGRKTKTCVDAVCKIFTKAGLQEYLPKGKNGIVSSNNNFMIDNLTKSDDWSNVTYTDDNGRKQWNSEDVSTGDWVIVQNDDPSQGKHSMLIVGNTANEYIAVHDPGFHSDMDIKRYSKEWIASQVRGIFRLAPSQDNMVRDVLDEIEF